MSTGIKNNKNLIPLKIIKLISDIVKSELISFVNDNSTKNNLNNKIKNNLIRNLNSFLLLYCIFLFIITFNSSLI